MLLFFDVHSYHSAIRWHVFKVTGSESWLIKYVPWFSLQSSWCSVFHFNSLFSFYPRELLSSSWVLPNFHVIILILLITVIFKIPASCPTWNHFPVAALSLSLHIALLFTMICLLFVFVLERSDTKWTKWEMDLRWAVTQCGVHLL